MLGLGRSLNILLRIPDLRSCCLGVLKYHPGKTQGPVGVQHLSPDNIPHATVIAAATHNSSPVKESSLVHKAELTDEKTVDSDVQQQIF
ncbi:camp-regulated phospho protein/endosulfine conserved region-domain-containing protein [Gigaspora margarita]|uniref:Camp-regulated phospho protein/endosulfine conserved region-domain-containing protein n=1 Tax=Gigaspora margarita TaxID=4874 RepID=A0A8H4ALX8_GIGMA|nr:camp-regulated phospho protein/endosulfine conserved region-domain-containing protein [Gigaspora margarita]